MFIWGGINHIPSVQPEHKGCLCLPLRPGERHTCRGLNRPPLTVVIKSYSEIKHTCARRCYNIGIVQRNVCSDSRGLGVSPCWREPAQRLFRTGENDHFLLRFDSIFFMRCSFVFCFNKKNIKIREQIYKLSLQI